MKIQIKSIYGKVLFEHEEEGNTIKETVEQAVKEGADLRWANLTGADLRDTVLIGAKLRGAKLTYSKLTFADFRGADLEGADLRGADLTGADLKGTKNKEKACMPMYCKWRHAIVDGKIKIGCEIKTPEEWKDWLDSDEEFVTPRGTVEFRQIEAVIRAYIAYQEVLTGNQEQ